MALSIAHTNINKSNTQLLLVAIAVLLLVALGYGYYQLHHYSVDDFTMPNPAYGLKAQKPLSSAPPLQASKE
jgi:hypothetical protein